MRAKAMPFGLPGPKSTRVTSTRTREPDFYCIERRHRILEPNGLKESRAQSHHGKIAGVPFIVNHNHGRWQWHRSFEW